MNQNCVVVIDHGTGRQHVLNHVPDDEDARDQRALVPRPHAVAALPTKFDNGDAMRGVPKEDQSTIGSCTANAVCRVMEYNHDVVCNKPGSVKHLDLARRWLYWKSREAEGTLPEDAGAQIRNVVKLASKLGVPAESLWPYDVKKYNQKPPAALVKEAAKARVVDYQRVGDFGSKATIDTGRAALVLGHLVVFGFQVPESFLSADVAGHGHVPMWNSGERLNGGHCMTWVGYDLEMEYEKPRGSKASGRGVAICDNSWGEDWGDGGRCYLPLPFLENARMSGDFWTVNRCEFATGLKLVKAA